jgi:hypothetical protein
MMAKKTVIVNFLGGPGVGKSTTATGLFSTLKRRNISAEYVSEYAKEVTWEETQKLLENQVHIFSEQLRRQWRLRGKVDFAITDSPLILSSVYYKHLNHMIPETQRYGEQMANDMYKFIQTTFDEFTNIVFEIKRTKLYVKEGRGQTEDEARVLDELTQQYCRDHNIQTYPIAYEMPHEELADLVIELAKHK